MISNSHLSLMLIAIIGQLCHSISELTWTYTMVGAITIHLENDNMCLKENISYETS